jgi:hypothetical protein
LRACDSPAKEVSRFFSVLVPLRSISLNSLSGV